MSHRYLRRALVWALLLVPVSAAFAEATYRLDIPPQPLAQALREFAEQSGLQIVYYTRIADGRNAERVVGTLAASEALARLLAGTDLIFQAVNADTIAIRSKAGDSAAQPGVTGVASDQPEALRLAQADATPATSAEASQGGELTQLEEVVVTGTHIRGVAPTGSPVLSYDRDAIVQSGQPSTQDFIRTIPQAFGGGSLGGSEDGVLGPGANAIGNVEAATTVNLRGLGENSTLVLLDGHRMASSAFGSIVDVSVIPLDAIDRIEILTDGSSAIYGADAVAGVMNFRLRREFTGLQSQLRYAADSAGSFKNVLANLTGGTSWSTGNILGAIQYDDRGSLSSASRSFTRDLVDPTDVLPAAIRRSAMVSAHQQVSPVVDLYANALLGNNAIRRSNTPTIGSGIDSNVTVRGANLTMGALYRFGASWQADLSGTYSKQEAEIRFDEFELGLPNYVLGDIAGRQSDTTKSAELKIDGPLMQLPAGQARLAVGGSYRTEDFNNSVIYDPNQSQSFDRNVASEFAEFYVPLMATVNVTAAVRHDQYSDFGGTTNFKYGAVWSPVQELRLRASYGTSFRAPNPIELSAAQSGLFVVTIPFASPTGGDDVPGIIVTGGNPELMPETSRNYSLGIDYHPLPASTVSLTYYDIRFRNRIITPPFDLAALLQRNVYGSLITDLPDDAAAAAFVSDAVARGATYLDFTPAGTGTDGVRFLFSQQQQNAAIVHQKGVDLTGSHQIDLGGGSLLLRGNIAHIDQIATQLAAGATAADLLNQYGTPLKWRARADISWTNHDWLLNVANNYSNGYTDTTVIPNGHISSDSTFDLLVQRTVGLGGFKYLRELTVGLSVLNVFDDQPPFVTGHPLAPSHFDVANADPIGRYISLTLTTKL